MGSMSRPLIGSGQWSQTTTGIFRLKRIGASRPLNFEGICESSPDSLRCSAASHFSEVAIFVCAQSARKLSFQNFANPIRCDQRCPALPDHSVCRNGLGAHQAIRNTERNDENWIMAVATQTAPVFVQQAFQWDDAESASSFSSNGRATTVADSETTRNSTIRPSSRPAITVPTFRTNSSARRGRCEHVGGMLATVLERYGIGLYQLIAEIDRQK